MINFPEGRYSDIRIEEVFQTDIAIENQLVRQNRIRDYKGALIRLYDGRKWYYAATTDLDRLQEELDQLARLADYSATVNESAVVRKFEVNQTEVLLYEKNCVRDVPRQDKLDLVQAYSDVCAQYPQISMAKAYYKESYEVKRFISSKGSDLVFDYQSASVSIRYNLTSGEKQGRGSKDFLRQEFTGLAGHEAVLQAEIEKDIAFMEEAVPVQPGLYTCVLAPLVTGVFAHESFGHKSEADFMIGDETMMAAWAIGSEVGSPDLTIIDRGDLPGNGYVPFDDDGSRARVSEIIKNGQLAGRLHSAATAAELAEPLSGNSRAVNFEFEPLVRMTNTYIEAGSLSKEELLAPIKEGLYIETLHHGSGMTTFTIAPHRAYMIRDGKIAEPVLISVLTGNVMETLHKIDGFSDKVEFFSFAMGGCGKMEQFPLRVSFGGPYIRVPIQAQ